MIRLLVLLSCWLIVPTATAQVIVSTTSFQTLASATTGPGTCTDSDGGVLVPQAIASCTDPKGNTAVASAQANLSASTLGGSVFVDAQAAAHATGIPPFEQPSANANSVSSISWELQDTYRYSLSTSTAGDVFVNFSGVSGSLPPSGALSPGVYSLNASADVSAVARDINGPETVTAIPESADVQLTFARSASISLIMGTALAGGVGQSGLTVQALDPTPLAATSTGDDGSYLLPDITGPVTIRVSDPEGNFVTAESALVSPPATVNFDLAPVVRLPALGAPPAALLCLMVGLAGLRLAELRRDASRG